MVPQGAFAVPFFLSEFHVHLVNPLGEWPVYNISLSSEWLFMFHQFRSVVTGETGVIDKTGVIGMNQQNRHK